MIESKNTYRNFRFYKGRLGLLSTEGLTASQEHSSLVLEVKRLNVKVHVVWCYNLIKQQNSKYWKSKGKVRLTETGLMSGENFCVLPEAKL